MTITALNQSPLNLSTVRTDQPGVTVGSRAVEAIIPPGNKVPSGLKRMLIKAVRGLYNLAVKVVRFVRNRLKPQSQEQIRNTFLHDVKQANQKNIRNEGEFYLEIAQRLSQHHHELLTIAEERDEFKIKFEQASTSIKEEKLLDCLALAAFEFKLPQDIIDSDSLEEIGSGLLPFIDRDTKSPLLDFLAKRDLDVDVRLAAIHFLQYLLKKNHHTNSTHLLQQATSVASEFLTPFFKKRAEGYLKPYDQLLDNCPECSSKIKRCDFIDGKRTLKIPVDPTNANDSLTSGSQSSPSEVFTHSVLALHNQHSDVHITPSVVNEGEMRTIEQFLQVDSPLELTLDQQTLCASFPIQVPRFPFNGLAEHIEGDEAKSLLDSIHKIEKISQDYTYLMSLYEKVCFHNYRLPLSALDTMKKILNLEKKSLC